MLASEVAAKLAALAESEKERAKVELSSNISRAEADKLNNNLKKAETAAVAQTKAAGVLESALSKEQELSRKLQRIVDTLTAQQSLLTNQLSAANATIASHEKAAQVALVQAKSQETTLVATQAALRKARRDAAEAGRAIQASKDAANEADELRREMLHLGSELLKEQGAMAEKEAQQAAKERANTRREARNAGNDDGACSSSEDSSGSLQVKVSALQRRLIVQKEATEKLAAALHQRDADVERLERSLAIRMEGDVAQKEIAHLRTALGAKEREVRAARAEVAALQQTLLYSEGKKVHGRKEKAPQENENVISDRVHIEAN